MEVSCRLVLGLSVFVGTGALLLLPGAVAALVVTRRTDAPDLAGRDVWWIATRGRLPNVDRPTTACGGYQVRSQTPSWHRHGIRPIRRHPRRIEEAGDPSWLRLPGAA